MVAMKIKPNSRQVPLTSKQLHRQGRETGGRIANDEAGLRNRRSEAGRWWWLQRKILPDIGLENRRKYHIRCRYRRTKSRRQHSPLLSTAPSALLLLLLLLLWLWLETAK